MDLKSYLREYVIKNIWCSPKQDRQAIFKLARITEYGGTWHNFHYGWTHLNLPTDDAPYHVYQIGQNCPVELGLFPHRGQWISLADLCSTTTVLPTLYLENGLQLPRSQSWICRTHDKNFLICVKEILRISSLNTEPLYLHLYTDAYYGSIRGNNKVDFLHSNGRLIRVANDISAIQNEIQSVKARVGYISIWLNGRYVNNISAAKVRLGDYVEYVYDPSVIAVVDFPMDELNSFTSQLDKLAKFILHPPKRGDEVIYYRDDIDIYLIKKDTSGDLDGIYYHRNREPSLRMLTHRDYSIPSTYVKGFIKDDAKWENDGEGIIIRLMLRESGYSRPLVHEAHRIHEIYKLNDEQIMRAFQGLDSTLPEWTADALESSLYAYLMRCWYPEILGNDCVTALGHNAITEIIGQTPMKVVHAGNNVAYVDLPWGLQVNSTIYEYDAEGLLLGWYYHRSGVRYYRHNTNCELIEAICGKGTQDVEAYYGKVDITLDPNKSYRFYISSLRSTWNVNKWRLVTEEDGYFTIGEDGKVEWLYDETRYVAAVVNDSTFLGYRLKMKQDDGFFRFHLNYTDIQGVVMDLPVGKVELWLNGRSLIPKLDYYIEWPEVVIVNKEWLKPDETNLVDIRCTDWARPDGSMLPIVDAGWISNHTLSTDTIYQIRDDHVIRTVADGRTFHRDDLVYAEQRYGVRVKTTANIDDGRPYWISDYHIPIPEIKDYDGDSLRADAEDMDKRVGDYLISKLKPPVYENLATTKWRYRVFSPLVTKLISDIQNEWFTPPQMPCTEQAMDEALVDYLYILPYEPARNGPNLEYLTIHPHPWAKTREVTINQYLFLEQVCQQYLYGVVDITQFVTVMG